MEGRGGSVGEAGSVSRRARQSGPPVPEIFEQLSEHSTVGELPLDECTVDPSTLGSAIAELFRERPTLPGIVVEEGGMLRGVLSRDRFLSCLGKPYGVERYLSHPVATFLSDVGLPALQVAEGTSIGVAARAATERPEEHAYEPLVVVLFGGEYRVLRVHFLFRAQSRLLALLNRSLHEQRALAESSNHAKSEFLASMSHELRTPLHAIIGYSEIAAEQIEQDALADAVRDIGHINRAGLHLLSLIDQILDLSRIEAGHLELCPSEVRVPDLVRNLVETVTPLVKGAGNRLLVECAPNLGTITADQTRLCQCLLNLLGNACKYTDNGDIRFAISRVAGGDAVCFRVRDSGIGIPVEQLDRIFEPFMQVDKSNPRPHGGAGLGLAIVARLCRAMGATIDVTSEAGKGSEFTLTIGDQRDTSDADDRGCDALANRVSSQSVQPGP